MAEPQTTERKAKRQAPPAKIVERRPIGRPPIPYDPELAEQICIELAASEKGIRALCDEVEGFPSISTVMKWLATQDSFQQMYTRAKQLQADLMGEDILDIADNEALQPHARRIKVDARRWVMSKLNPRKYGDKLDVTSGGEALPAGNTTIIDQRVQSIMLLAQQRRDQEAERLKLID
jgi:hypothetical protein